MRPCNGVHLWSEDIRWRCPRAGKAEGAELCEAVHNALAKVVVIHASASADGVDWSRRTKYEGIRPSRQGSRQWRNAEQNQPCSCPRKACLPGSGATSKGKLGLISQARGGRYAAVQND